MGNICFDGPTMVKLILLQIEPDTIVGMESLKAQLETMKLHEFGNDASKIQDVDQMQSIYNTLKQKCHTPDQYRGYLYNAMKTGPNAEFNGFIDFIVDDIQSGCGFNKDITSNQAIIVAQTKYNNMIEDKTGGNINPCDATIIMALTTKIDLLEKSHGAPIKPDAAVHGTIATGGDGASSLPPGNSMINEWRMKFDGKMKEVGGLTYWWCKHHKTKDHNGLYVSSHSPDHHGAWSKTEKEGKCGNFCAKPAASTASNDSSSKKEDASKKISLGPNDRLKQVLMTNASIRQ